MKNITNKLKKIIPFSNFHPYLIIIFSKQIYSQLHDRFPTPLGETKERSSIQPVAKDVYGKVHQVHLTVRKNMEFVHWEQLDVLGYHQLLTINVLLSINVIEINNEHESLDFSSMY